tara:strand:+ start:99 stop:995 length:897 start_codon:yes stop_codon:yes gene_type:complete
MIKGSKHLAIVKPIIKHAVATAYAANDVLIDWYPFQVPRGGCRIKSLHATIAGTNGDATSQENQKDFSILFAKSIDGIRPPSMGAANAAVTDVNMTACRSYIVGHKYLDVSKLDQDTPNDAIFKTYRMIDINAMDADYDEIAIFIDGEPGDYRARTNQEETATWKDAKFAGLIPDPITGYQTMFLGAIATEAGADFGTAMTLNMAGGAALAATAITSTTSMHYPVAETTITITGTDATKVLSVGDIVGDASATAKIIGKVTEVVDADNFKVDYVREGVAHNTEIVNLTPITFNFGIEY